MSRIKKRLPAIYRLVIFELKALIKSVFSTVKVHLTKSKIKGARIEIGSSNPRVGFFTLDLDKNADFPFDLRNGLPFYDESISFLYAEHVLEHFSYDEFVYLLHEIRRVLKEGGILSIVVPDIRPILKAYTASGNEFSGRLTYEYPPYLKEKLDIINFLFYMDGAHKYAFDVDNITRALMDAGFTRIRVRDFDPSLDKIERKENSLYVECFKDERERSDGNGS